MLDQFFAKNDSVIPPYFESSIHALEDKTSPFLEVVSTYAFLLETETDQQAAIEKTKELKPHLEDSWMRLRNFMSNLCNLEDSS